jgi:hypothetical protein
MEAELVREHEADLWRCDRMKRRSEAAKVLTGNSHAEAGELENERRGRRVRSTFQAFSESN